jgi:hypothetical protein
MYNAQEVHNCPNTEMNFISELEIPPQPQTSS